MTVDSQTVPQAKAGTFQPWRVATIALGHCVHDTYNGILPQLIPIFIGTLGISKAQAGLLAVFMRWPSLLQPFLGNLADKRDLRSFFFLGIAATAVLMSLTVFAPSYPMLVATLLAAGVAGAAFHSVGPAMAGSLSGNRVGAGMSIWMVGGTLGFTLGPILITAAVGVLGLQGSAAIMAIGLVTSALLYIALRDVRATKAATRTGEAMSQGLRKMAPVMLPLGGILFVRLFALGAMQTFLPTYMTEQGETLWMGGIALSVYQGAGVLGALIGGSLSDRIGCRKVLLFSLVTTVPLMLAFLFVRGWLMFPVLALLGVSVLSLGPVDITIAQKSFPDSRAMASGVVLTLNFVFNALDVFLVGVMGDRWGLRTAYLVSALLPLIGLPLVAMLPRDKAI